MIDYFDDAGRFFLGPGQLSWTDIEQIRDLRKLADLSREKLDDLRKFPVQNRERIELEEAMLGEILRKLRTIESKFFRT